MQKVEDLLLNDSYIVGVDFAVFLIKSRIFFRAIYYKWSYCDSLCEKQNSNIELRCYRYFCTHHWLLIDKANVDILFVGNNSISYKFCLVCIESMPQTSMSVVDIWHINVYIFESQLVLHHGSHIFLSFGTIIL